MTVTLGLLGRLEAKPGKEQALADFLASARELALAEQQTVTWYAFRLNDREFGIFDTFTTEQGRRAHLDGEIGRALSEMADDLLVRAPEISPVDVLAVK